MKHAITVLLVIALCALCAPAQTPTTLTTKQLRSAPTSGVWVSTPNGFQVARLEGSLTLDLTNPLIPVLRATTSAPVAIKWTREQFSPVLGVTTYTLQNDLADKESLFVYRNGLLQTENVDFTISGRVITFTLWLTDDLIVLRYPVTL
jgi:hypothetical protein